MQDCGEGLRLFLEVHSKCTKAKRCKLQKGKFRLDVSEKNHSDGGKSLRLGLKGPEGSPSIGVLKT